MINEPTPGAWLRARREALALTRPALAARSHCTADTIKKIEEGQRSPSEDLAVLLVQALELPPAERPAAVQWLRGQRAHPPDVALAGASTAAPGTTPSTGGALRPQVAVPGATPAEAGAAPPSLQSALRSLTPLIGREPERADVTALLRQEEVCLVTLTGEGGIGKTRLALAVAGDLQANFATGIVYVDLAPVRDPARVPAALAAALGMIETAQESWTPRLAALLGPHELLLVLDNFEQVVAAAPLLADLLRAAPRVKALVTSRAVLEVDGEQVYRLAPLPAPAAEALFVARARAVQPALELTADNAAAIAAICARLAGLPLAVELAAAHSRLLPPAALLAQLTPSLPLLAGERRDRPARQQTLRATLDWSYGLLPPPAQQLFQRLAVFAGGIPLAALAALTERAGAPAILAAEVLINHSLLRPDEHAAEPRLLLLEPVREYADEHLQASGEEARARQAHARYYLALAEEAAPALRGAQPQPWLARLDQEQANLRAALGWAMPGDRDLAGRMASALWPFWLARGYWSEGRRWLDAILADGGAGSPAQRASLLQGAGTLARVQGDYGPARRWLQESLALYRELEDRRGAAGCLYELADIVRAGGDRAGGLRLGEESVALYRAAGDPVGITNALLFCVSEEDAAATARWQEALALAREIQYRPGIAMALHRLGGLAEGQDAARATALHEESLALFRELGDLRRMAMVTEVLGEVARAAGDLAQAQGRFAEALPLWQRVGSRAGLLSVHYNFAGVAQEQERWAPMAEYARRGLEEARAAGNVAGICEGLLLLGDAQRQLGEPGALASYGEVVARLPEHSSRRQGAWVLVGLATLAVQAGRLREAAQLLGAAEARGAAQGPLQAAYTLATAAVRAGLGEEERAPAWATGRGWTLAEIRTFRWADLSVKAAPAPLGPV